MAQTNYTPISLYYSATASNVPSASNLVAGELAINTADGKLFYKDSSNNVKVIAANVAAIANGGSGATTAQGAMNAFAGAVTSGSYLRGNGTNVVMSAIQAGDVPTLNQNTTGTAGNVTGTVAVANGGTGQTSANSAFNALAPSQSANSGKFLTTDGTNTSWATVSGGSGTVTSVGVSGGTTGLTTSGGPITSSGTITLAGTLAVANGGTGNSTGAATAIVNAGGWSVSPSGTNLYFSYNGTNVGKLDSSGNLTVIGNVTAYGTV
jgi:hypothetical protein